MRQQVREENLLPDRIEELMAKAVSVADASLEVMTEELTVEEIEKGPKPLLIDAAGHRRKGLAANADHEDAALVLPFKSRLTGRANNEDGTLLNAHQGAGSGSHEVILHNKTFKNEKITAKAACSIQCGMGARPKRKRNKCGMPHYFAGGFLMFLGGSGPGWYWLRLV
jgi:hypothetical protein